MARESTIGSTFKLQTLPAAASAPMTAVVKAASTTTITATGTYAKGDFVILAGTGLATLDRKTAHRVSAIAAGTFTIDTGTSAETATPTMGTVTKAAFTTICFAEFGVESPAPNEVDVTTMCDLARRNVAGLANTGSATFGGPLDLADPGQQALLAAFRDGLPRQLVWTTRGGQNGMLYGVVTSYAAAPQGVEQAVTYSGTFQIQDPPAYNHPLV